MDILKPGLVWIDGRCYRKLPIRTENLSNNETPREEHHATTNRKNESQLEEEDDAPLPIKHEGARFLITINVPQELIGYVLGKKGHTKAQIEGETSTKIRVPQMEVGSGKNRQREQDILISIDGASKTNVAAAYRRIEHIANSARWKGDYTHFISIPINNLDIQEGFQKFKQDVLQNCRGLNGVNERVFEPPERLHLTIAMLTLLSDREKESAANLIKGQRSQIKHLLGGKTFQIEIKGVEYMNDDPSEVDVLYGKVKETDSDSCLQIISDELAKAFAKSNLSRGESDHVKLHVTLMKSKTEHGERQTFDARKILEKYSDYSFGKMVVSEIHISVRFTGGTSYYRSLFVLRL